jgi:hypothetical protein
MALEREFVQSMNDWIKWYNYNRRSAENAGVEQKLAFQQKAIQGLFFVVAAMADEMARIDGGTERDARPNLLIPVSAQWR